MIIEGKLEQYKEETIDGHSILWKLIDTFQGHKKYNNEMHPMEHTIRSLLEECKTRAAEKDIPISDYLKELDILDKLQTLLRAKPSFMSRVPFEIKVGKRKK